MPTHLLSVVMPTHNRAGLLERAARSVLDQDVTDIELVIVDDASTDATSDVADRLSCDRRVTVLHNPESLGPGGSRNRGIAAARGDLLGFCDDDDTWLPGAATTVLDRFDDDPRVGRGVGLAPGRPRTGRPDRGLPRSAPLRPRPAPLVRLHRAALRGHPA